jgi:hypothetical protein
MKTEHPPARRPRVSAGLLATCAILAAAGFSLAGCAHSYEVKVDALAKPKAEEAVSYEIHNANPLVADDSLRYKEAAGFVKTALSGKGMYEAPDSKKADMVVDLDYGIGPPQMHRETVSEPVYITLPGRIYQETVQVGTDAKGSPIYQTVTRQEPPSTEMAGFREYEVTSVVYEKYLKLSARENKPATEGHPPSEIWTIDATSEGESHDVRKNLPILVAASIEYIGKDTHGQKVIHLKDGSPDVVFVKKGMPPDQPAPGGPGPAPSS